MSDQLIHTSESYVRRTRNRHALRRGVGSGAWVGLITLLITLPFVMLGVAPNWLLIVLVALLGTVVGLLAACFAWRETASESATLWLLKRLDNAVGAEDGLLTTMSIRSSPVAKVGASAQFLSLLGADMTHRVRAQGTDPVIPAFPTRSLSLGVVVVGLSLASLLVLPELRPDEAGPNATGMEASASDSSSPSANPDAADPDESAVPRRVVRPPGGALRGSDLDRDPGNTGTSEGESSKGDADESKGTEGEVDPDPQTAQPGDGEPGGSRPVRPRTSEPSFLKPAPGGDPGFTPTLAGPQEGPQIGSPPAQMPWERPVDVPGVPPHEPRAPSTTADDSLDRPTGERRRPPVRPSASREQPKPEQPYVEQPMKILPEISDGDRKAVEARRLVYSPDGSAMEEADIAKASDGSGMPSKASAPPRTPNVRGGTSESERAWLEIWTARYTRK